MSNLEWNKEKEEQEAINNLRLNCTNAGFTVYDGTTILLKARDIQVVLNYISRLQKENEDKQIKINELLTERERIINNLEVDLQRIGVYAQAKGQIAQVIDFLKENASYNEKELDFVSKDKIREELKHAKEVLENLDNEQDILVQKIVINYLEDLLKE